MPGLFKHLLQVYHCPSLSIIPSQHIPAPDSDIIITVVSPHVRYTVPASSDTSLACPQVIYLRYPRPHDRHLEVHYDRTGDHRVLLSRTRMRQVRRLFYFHESVALAVPPSKLIWGRYRENFRLLLLSPRLELWHGWSHWCCWFATGERANCFPRS